MYILVASILDHRVCKSSPSFFPYLAVNCGELSGPANGYVRHSVTTYNAFAYYHCNTGYDLSGPYHRRCGSNGEWSGEEPTCERECSIV